MKKALASLLLALLSTVVALIGADLLLRLADPDRFTPKNEHAFQKPALYALSRIKELGYELRPGAEVEVQGVTYRINRIGFRDIEHRLRKADRRVIVVGDSLTFGWNVPLEDTFVHLTRERLKAEGRTTEIMAMGIIGYNIRQEYHLIKERGLKFDPDLVILQICLNDFERALGIRTDPKRKFMVTHYSEIAVPYVFKKTRLSRWLMAHSYVFKLLNLRLADLIGKGKDDSAPRDVYSQGTESAAAYLQKTRELLAGMNRKFAAVLFPYRSDCMRAPYADFHRAMVEELAALSIPTLNLNSALNAAPGSAESLWADYVHPNRSGNELVAGRLAAFIISLLEDKADGPE
jgi:lysophospholipase L1-like esterase